MGKLHGKVAVVTASTEGIGFAIAEKLAKDGAKVVVSSRKQNNVDAAVTRLRQQGLQVVGCVSHVGKKEDRQKLLEKAAEEFGGVDIVVSNAGTNPAYSQVLQTSEAEWDKIMDTNVKSTFFICKEAYPYLQKRGGGSIVLVSSIAGYQPTSVMGVYATSKTALLGLTKAMAPQLAESNIRINCIAPGVIQTKFSRALWQNQDVLTRVTSEFPMKRMGRPEECAGAVSFLVSDDASYITGETIAIAGGARSHL